MTQPNSSRLVSFLDSTILLSLLFLSAEVAAVEGKVQLSQMEVVDCIVEGSVRQMGRSFVYQEPPRMARLTQFECASLGGTFKIYDPTEPDSVMEQWLPFAERGDADAQHRLGLLYEGAMGAEANYEKAAYWYTQAAAQGHREALYSMSVFFEKGLGVEKDLVEAVNWYRKASGLENDSIMLSSQAYAEIEEMRESLKGELASVEIQRDVLWQQVEDLRAKQNTSGGSEARVEVLESLINDLSASLDEKEASLAKLPVVQVLPEADQADDAPPPVFKFQELPGKLMRQRQIGRFYAVVIGNTDYRWLPFLATPGNDATIIAELLEKKYGFSTQLLIDADEEEIKRAIYTVETAAKKDDNILIYFAGHGRMNQAERARMKGYWMPTNADPTQDANWVDNWWITDHLDASPAKRALIIADSCYGGVFSTDLPIGPVLEMPEFSDKEMRAKLERRSRFVLSSGGLQPFVVADENDSSAPGNSVFAAAFIDVLEENTGSLSVVELYGRVFDKMDRLLRGQGPMPEPELRVIRAAGHESEGDYFFVKN
jgi:hypothetical protein